MYLIHLRRVKHADNHERVGAASDVPIFVGAEEEVNIALLGKLREVFLVEVFVDGTFLVAIFAHQLAAELINFPIEDL